MSDSKRAPVCSFSSYGNILTEAFQTDVENFLLLFRQRSSIKFSDFAESWKEMKFSHVYSQQRYYTFLKQFTDNCFFVLIKFIVFPTDIKMQIGGIFLLYSLYFKQLVKDWVKIRITHEEHEKIQYLMNKLREEKHLEPLFCYAKLVASNAFEYVFLKKPLAPEPNYLKSYKESLDDVFKSGRTGTTYLVLKQRLNENNFLERLTKVSAAYDEALADFAVTHPAIDASNSSIIEDIESTLTVEEPSTDKAEASTSSSQEEDSVYSRRQSIKRRAASSKTSPKFKMMKIEEESFSDFGF